VSLQSLQRSVTGSNAILRRSTCMRGRAA